MALGNRYHIMIDVLGRRKISDRVKFACWELFQVAVLAVRSSPASPLWKALWGRILACNDICFGIKRA
jgi:hypothetical protein